MQYMVPSGCVQLGWKITVSKWRQRTLKSWGCDYWIFQLLLTVVILLSIYRFTLKLWRAKRIISSLKPLAKLGKKNLQRNFFGSFWSFSLSCFSIPGESGISSSIASSGSTVCWAEIFQTGITFTITLDVILRMTNSEINSSKWL